VIIGNDTSTTIIGTGGTGGTGGTPTNTCEAQVADGTGTPVTVRLVNQTSGDLYLAISNFASCTQTRAFDAKVPDATLDANAPPADPCGGSTCSTLKCSACTVTWTCSMHVPVTRIAAGGILTSSWNGLAYQTRSVPSACVPGPECWSGSGGATVSCPVAVANTSWPVTFTAQMSTGVSCASGSCTCTPDATGTCELPIGDVPTLSSALVQGMATLSEGGTSIDIVFSESDGGVEDGGTDAGGSDAGGSDAGGSDAGIDEGGTDAGTG
jgi:hypothetical protein